MRAVWLLIIFSQLSSAVSVDNRLPNEEEGNSLVHMLLLHDQEEVRAEIDVIMKANDTLKCTRISLEGEMDADSLFLFVRVIFCILVPILCPGISYPNCGYKHFALDYFGDGDHCSGNFITLRCKFEDGDCVNFLLASPLCKGRGLEFFNSVSRVFWCVFWIYRRYDKGWYNWPSQPHHFLIITWTILTKPGEFDVTSKNMLVAWK